MSKFFCLILLSTISSTFGLKIFGCLSFGTYSHFAIGDAIMKTLWKAGHNITVISPYPNKEPLENYRDISTEDILNKFRQDQLPDGFKLRKLKPLDHIFHISDMGKDTVNAYMNHQSVLELMDSGETFDICMFENFNAEALMGLADHFNCTLITYTSLIAVTWTDEMTSNQSPMSYVPHQFLPYTERMTFFERLTNLKTRLFEKFYYNFHHLPQQKKLYEKYFPNAKKNFYEIVKSSAIIFINNHVSLSSARPYLPNIIEINGIQMGETKPLPAILKQYLDNATDGAILFSMGSVIQANKWPHDKREALINAFSKLKQKVIWKYENETIPNKPDNVMITSWVPQRDILMHPNVKLFITHGGLLSTTEAAYAGVPVLGIPVFGDQKMNMLKYELRGCGIRIMFDEISEDKLMKALIELLNNPKYTENAQQLSRRFRDRPMTPQESVVFWTEYVARHDGAEFLRAAGNDMNFIQFHLIDIYCFLLSIVVIVLAVLRKVIKFLYHAVANNHQKLKSKKNM